MIGARLALYGIERIENPGARCILVEEHDRLERGILCSPSFELLVE
jgi:hypothetical protein